MQKRSGKFYYRNERETLDALGFKQVAGSGNGWLDKEDGESETTLVQLKSTDKSSYRLDMLDMKKLEYHAEVAHKIPLFLVQFLQQDKIYAIISVDNICDLQKMFETGEVSKDKVIDTSEVKVRNRNVSSSSKAMKQYRREVKNTWQRKKK